MRFSHSSLLHRWATPRPSPCLLCSASSTLACISLEPKQSSENGFGLLYNSIINAAQPQTQMTDRIWIGPLLFLDGIKQATSFLWACSKHRPAQQRCTAQPARDWSSATCKSHPGTPWIRADESFKMSGKSLGTEMLYVFYTVSINFKWEGKAARVPHFSLSCVCPLLTGCSQQDWCCAGSSGWAQGEQKVLVEKDQNIHHVAWHRTFRVELNHRGANPTSNFC